MLAALGRNAYLQNRQLPISRTYPQLRSFSKNESVKPIKTGVDGFGELMRATFIQPTFNPTNWLLFEKYDGIRGFWDPVQRKFFSRSGNVLKIPEEVTQNMPDIFLDGEIWFGRGNFKETAKISSKSDSSKIDWKNFRYMAFDLPKEPQKPFEERYQILQTSIPSSHPFVKVAPARKCQGKEDMEQFSKSIIEQGAEGIILRNPTSLYKQGFSKDFVKSKVFRDEEARVVDRLSPTTWKCELPNGHFFEVPADFKALEATEPQHGDIVSFKYTRYGNNPPIPISPVIYRIRQDMTWEDVLNSKRNIRKLKLMPHPKKQRQQSHPMGYWTDTSNVRKFFEDLAKKQGFDSSNPENWYQLSLSDVTGAKGSGILPHYSSYRHAIVDAFPELNLKIDNFSKPRNFSDTNVAREFLMNFAESNGFDPLDPENWYKIKHEQILQTKGGSSFLIAYNTSLRKALLTVFPDLTWDVSKFKKQGYWTDIKNVRAAFDEYASENGFDSLNPDNWYPRTKSLKSSKNFISILNHYDTSVKKALCAAYPELPWDHTKFFKHNHWNKPEIAREALIQFAKEQGADPMDVNWWYSVKPTQLPKKLYDTLSIHYGRFSKVVEAAFPELNWDLLKLHKKSYWDNPDNCRQYLLNFAKQHNFDPKTPENWYGIHKNQFREAYIVDNFGSVYKMLKSAFPELELEEKKFDKYSKWNDIAYKSNILQQIASLNGFDVNNTEAWRRVKKEDFRLVQGGDAMWKHFGSLERILASTNKILK